MKSKVLLSLALSMSVMGAIAQKDNVGIGTTKPDQSAVLDISSSNKGLLTPRMTLHQRNSIQSPAQGLMVYQTDLLSGFYFYDGKEWKPMTSETNSNSVADASNWGLTGNAGTNAATNFIGTTDNVSLVFKVGGSAAGFIETGGSYKTLFGLNAGPRIGAAAFGNTGVGYAVLGGEVLTTVTGQTNTAFGHDALGALTEGSSNAAIGYNALRNTTAGNYNLALGATALRTNITGNDNVAIGYSALLNSTSNSNVGIGTYALTSTTGAGNVGIGTTAGENKTGDFNVYIGFNAGRAAAPVTENNKLYIANSSTVQPTVYGDFSANFISIGNNITLAKRDAIATSGAYGLLVEKGILTEKIKVATLSSTDWADYVFDKDYKRISLEEVEQFVKENKHLPNVPTTAEMMVSGSDLIKTDAKLLEKIEELTLYLIDMNKELKALKKENESIKKGLKK